MGNYSNDSYRTKGGTNGPKAINTAAQILSGSPPPAADSHLSGVKDQTFSSRHASS
jgi:hypothetical protein